MQLTRPARVKLPASVNFMTIRPVHVRPPEPPTFAVFEFRILAASADQVPTMLLLEDGVVVEVAEVVGLAEGDAVDPSLEVPLQAVSTPASATAHIEVRMTGLREAGAENGDRMELILVAPGSTKCTRVERLDRISTCPNTALLRRH